MGAWAKNIYLKLAHNAKIVSCSILIELRQLTVMPQFPIAESNHKINNNEPILPKSKALSQTTRTIATQTCRSDVHQL